jgi:hypothetical protein
MNKKEWHWMSEYKQIKQINMKSINGTVKKILELEKKGDKDFLVQEVIITTEQKVNPDLKITFKGDNTDFVNRLQEGYVFEFMINLYCNEWKGTYYNNIDCWGVKQLNPEGEKKEEKGFVPVGAESDLPF